MTAFAVAAAGAPWERIALSSIDRSSHLSLARRCVDVTELLAVLRTGGADVALIDPRLPGLDLDVVRELASHGAVATCGEALLAAELGILRRVDAERLADVDWRQPAPVPRPPTGSEAPGPGGAFPGGTAAGDLNGRVVALWGPAGAPGRSSLAIAIASAVRHRLHTVLVDADVAGGTVAQQLGVLDDTSALVAANRAAGHGRMGGVDASLLQVEPGFDVVTGLIRSEQWTLLRAGSLEAVIERLRATHELVILDLGSGLDVEQGPGRSRHAVTRQLLELADEVIAVGRADPVGLSRLVRGLFEIDEIIGPDRPLRIVINHMRGSLGWSEADIAATLRRLSGREPELFLPSDMASHDAAIMRGRTVQAVAPKSMFVRRVNAFAASIGRASAVVASPSR